MAQMRQSFRFFLLFLVIAGGLGVLYFAGQHFGIGIQKAVTASNAKLPVQEDAVVANVQAVAYPTTTPNGCGDPIRSEIWMWNSQMGELYANGGKDTTKGSLMEKHGACVHFNVQPDTGQMKVDLLACAKELKSSSDCTDGVNFVTIMADGAGQFLAGYNAEAKKICSDCTAEIIGTTGFSRGEDALWGPAVWKKSPRSMLGDGLIAGVLRDGDWDTGLKYEGDNVLKNNPDEHTFDPNAVNWVNADDYLKAAEMYITGYCEDRKVVQDGKPTGETKNFCVRGFVTWTPGDVNAAKKKGGLVRVVSTKQYRSQMPSAIIGIKKWDKAHGDAIANMLAGALEGGDQVKAFPKALELAGNISAKVYGENNGAYWVKYYQGTVEPDATGQPVELGGSYADGMNDALAVFGLDGRSANNVKATYTTFARIVMEQYGGLFKNTPIPPYEQAANTSYLLQAKSLLDNAGSQADTPQYSATDEPAQVVGDKNYDIEFATGSAQLTSAGMQTVQQIKDEASITGLIVVLNGHTDNTGNAVLNRNLSKARAESVAKALQMAAPGDFPEARFRIHGYGPDRPATSNDTAEGRAKNRRVEVILADTQKGNSGD